MHIATVDVSSIAAAVRRREALLRYARYLLLFNLAAGGWFVIVQFWHAASVRTWTALAPGPEWRWTALALASVAVTYLVLAHRLWWLYAPIVLVQVVYFLATPSPDKQIFRVSALAAYGAVVLPPMRPLLPLAAELAVMNIVFAYVMFFWCLYSAAWSARAPCVPLDAYGPPMSALEPFRPSRLLETLLPGRGLQRIAPAEAALFALSSVLFVAASMAPFYGLRRVQNEFLALAPHFLACSSAEASEQGAEATIACWGRLYLWSHPLFHLGAPIGAAVLCLVLANRLRYFGRGLFLRRLAAARVSAAGATLFLRAFRDDQVRIRRANRNIFSVVFDLGRMPSTLDELMLERLDGHGDLIAIGNPRDRDNSARGSPWGAQRLYVDDAHWRETVAQLMAEAGRIVLCLDSSEGVQWEIAHVLRQDHAGKTVFFLNPSIDAGVRRRLLAEDFAIPASDLAAVDLDKILALRLFSSERVVMICARPERDAYLAVMRLAFAEPSGRADPTCLRQDCVPEGIGTLVPLKSASGRIADLAGTGNEVPLSALCCPSRSA
jgi:hypothetical protein